MDKFHTAQQTCCFSNIKTTWLMLCKKVTAVDHKAHKRNKCPLWVYCGIPKCLSRVYSK